MEYLRRIFGKVAEGDSTGAEDTSGEEILQTKMLQLVLVRGSPTRFEHITSKGKRVAVWCYMYRSKSNILNHKRYDGDLEEGTLPLIPKGTEENRRQFIEGSCSVFAHDLGKIVKINDTWFDSQGSKSDEYNSSRYEEYFNEMPLTML